MFDIELTNRSIIKLKGYNEMVDYCYSNLEIGDLILIEGNINHNMEIVPSMIKNLE